MNEERNGIVVKLNYNGIFKPTTSVILYVHNIEFDNGDKGITYCQTEVPPSRLDVGEHIVYTIDSTKNNKVSFLRTYSNEQTENRLVSPPNASPQVKYGESSKPLYAKNINATKNNDNRIYMNQPKGLEANMGYAFSYAKDHVGNTFNLYKDILVKRMDEKIQRMLSSGKYEYLSDIPLRELFDEEMELFLKTARYNYEQMGSSELRAYDGSVNVEQELKVKNELTILAPLRKEVKGTGNAKGNKTVLVNTTEEALKIVDDTDFDIEEPKDDFLKELNEDFNSLTEDKKGKNKK